MKKEVNNGIPIHVDLAPNRDEVYSGICIKSNDEIFILICYNEESNKFDGYAIIRDYEIEKYREWDEEELQEIQTNNSADYLDKISLDKMNNMFECLSELKDEELIAIFDESDDDSYYVGQIKNLTEKEVEMKLLNEDAQWIETKKISIDKITYIGFGTSYEKELIRKTLYNNI